MKKFLFVLVFSILLVGCGSNEEATKETTPEDLEKEEKQEEMLDSAVLAYMEQMTGKYLMIDNYEDRSSEQQKLLDEALTSVNLAVLEIEDKYNVDIPVVKELNDLAESVSFAINELLAGEYSTKVDNSHDVGGYVGEISRNYLDGELPPTTKIMTGKENAFD